MLLAFRGFLKFNSNGFLPAFWWNTRLLEMGKKGCMQIRHTTTSYKKMLAKESKSKKKFRSKNYYSKGEKKWRKICVNRKRRQRSLRCLQQLKTTRRIWRPLPKLLPQRKTKIHPYSEWNINHTKGGTWSILAFSYLNILHFKRKFPIFLVLNEKGELM